MVWLDEVTKSFVDVKAVKIKDRSAGEYALAGFKKVLDFTRASLKFYVAYKEWQGPPRAEVVRQRFRLLVRKAMIQNGII